MKIVMTVAHLDGNNAWEETYDQNCEDEEAAREWAEGIIAGFNASLRPHERARRLMGVKVVDGTNTGHAWDKDLTRMSVQFRGQVIDGMICRTCGVTGKRKGFSTLIKIDSKFKRKIFQTCTPETRQAVREVEQRSYD